jgi:hypothetical protein
MLHGSSLCITLHLKICVKERSMSHEHSSSRSNGCDATPNPPERWLTVAVAPVGCDVCRSLVASALDCNCELCRTQGVVDWRWARGGMWHPVRRGPCSHTDEDSERASSDVDFPLICLIVSYLDLSPVTQSMDMRTDRLKRVSEHWTLDVR